MKGGGWLLSVLALALTLLAAMPAPGARRSPQRFKLAVPGRKLVFPADDFAHPGFANEWWYFTGNLRTAQGRKYGFELTFFRISPAPGTPLDRDFYFTHFAISDIGGKKYSSKERARRGNWGQAGVAHTAHGFKVWNENWEADFDASGPRQLRASWGAMKLDFALTPDRRMLNGVDGWSQKGSGRGEASYYYSFPDIAAAGDIDGNAVSGHVWMDHEFASDQLSSGQQGWDWMGLKLDDGASLMLFNLRDVNGARDPHSAGTIRPKGGQATAFGAAAFSMTPLKTWRGYPIAWRVRVPSRGLDLRVTAQLDGQLFHAPATGVTYWEGAVSVTGTEHGRAISGNGYLELTGYGARFDLLQSAPSRARSGRAGAASGAR